MYHTSARSVRILLQLHCIVGIKCRKSTRSSVKTTAAVAHEVNHEPKISVSKFVYVVLVVVYSFLCHFCLQKCEVGKV